MAKVIRFNNNTTPLRFGHHKVKKRKKKVDLEEFGQLNLFDSDDGKVVSIHGSSAFEEALRLDEEEDPAAEKYYLQ